MTETSLPPPTQAIASVHAPKLPYFAACVTLIALIFLGIVWEARLAPIIPGGSALVFKVLPLLAAVFGILNGKRYTYKWSSLLILFYFAEGLVRATSDHGLGQWLAIAEIVLCLIFFTAAVMFLRKTRP